MNQSVYYEFEWDDAKAELNLRKHGVAFSEAMTVFADPLAMTIFDAAHSDAEDRWVSVGLSSRVSLLLVIHTFVNSASANASIRIISARPATKRERQQYEQGLLQ